MIIVSRLNGERFGVNAEHLERVESTPDTVLTLLDGRKYIVRESLEDVIDLVVNYRANVLRVSYAAAPEPEPSGAPLRLVDPSMATEETIDAPEVVPVDGGTDRRGGA